MKEEMTMKKLFTTLFAISSLLSISAQAKTEGSYAGIDLLRTNATFNERFTDTQEDPETRVATNVKPSFSGHSYGLGLNYKYALNFNGFFIAPGVFAERNNNKFQGTRGKGLRVNNRYGVKADFGYDVTNKIAPYFTAGYSLIDYRTTNNHGNDVASKSGNAGDWFYGLGLKLNVTENVAMNLEYNTQNFAAKTAIPNNDIGYSGIYKTRLDVLKLGLSYGF